VRRSAGRPERGFSDALGARFSAACWGAFSVAPAAVRSRGERPSHDSRRSHGHEEGSVASWRPPGIARAASVNSGADTPVAKGRGSAPFFVAPAPGRLLCRRPSSPARSGRRALAVNHC